MKKTKEHGLAFRALRWTIFWVGDTRRIHHFPWCTWDVHQHRIDLNEVMLEALPILRPGDVILHRDEGFLSNVGIGGVMVHAGIYMGQSQVVEALSEGVVRRHAGHILYSDYACILRPQLGDERAEATEAAIGWANRIVGYPYDVLFDFSSEQERVVVLEAGEGMAEGVRFCCTEIPHFCYLDYTTRLDVYRKRNVGIATKALSLVGLNPGTAIITADMYIEANFELVWASSDYTPKWAEKKGASEEHLRKLQDYWDVRG